MDHTDHRPARPRRRPTPSVTRRTDTGRPTGRRRRTTVLAGTIAVAVLALGATGCITAANVSGGVLTIAGSAGADVIGLRLKSGDANTLEVDSNNDGTAEYSFDRSTFTSITVDGQGGDDTLTLSTLNGTFTDEAVTLLGGPGNDQLVGANGIDVLDGGAGNDVIDGNQGNDVLRGAADTDSFSWTPGEGSDSIDAGTGTDHFGFSGANASEVLGLSNSSGHVRLTRDVANIDLDMVGLESIDLDVLGGTDVMTVGNLTGTGLANLRIDLAASGGGDDGTFDEVRVPSGTVIGRTADAATVGGAGVGSQVEVVNGTALDRILVNGAVGVDQVQFAGTGSTDVVSAAANGDVVVLGMTPGLGVTLSGVDQAVFDLGGGNDQFSTSGNLAAVMGLGILGGSGRDTILGGNGGDLIDGGPGADVIDGNQGNDLLLGGTEEDLFSWDPGDGSDTIDGGSASDQLVFNGSNIAENLDLSAQGGGHVRFTRDVAAITLDLVGVEAMDINALGGSDILTVHDVSGTGLGAIAVNLAGDGLADQVTVEGTAGADVVQVVGLGSVVEVDGLPAVVRVSGSDGGFDSLTVNGMAGADTLSATPAAAALILVSLVP